MDQPSGPSATRTALAIRHVAFEDLGSFAPALARRGFTLRYLDAGYDDLAAPGPFDLLVVLGGPIGANDEADYPFLRDELRLIERQASASRPTLGICLGAQIMARALGAKVYAARAKEIGFKPVRLSDAGRVSCLAPLGERPLLHWHGDTFDLPPGARHLAATDICPNQAFAWGARDALLALQFHPEVTPRGLERWLIGHCGELAREGLSLAELRRDAALHGAAMEAATIALLDRWLAEVTAR